MDIYIWGGEESLGLIITMDCGRLVYSINRGRGEKRVEHSWMKVREEMG